MRFQMASVLVLVGLTVGACGGEPAPEAGTTAATTTTTPAATASPSPPGPSPAEGAFLAHVREGLVLGDYSDGDLLALGHGFCQALADGREIADLGLSTGDGAFIYPDLGVHTPIYATDVIGIGFAARMYLCPGT